MMDLRSIALALGGDVVGANTVNCPGPGHSPRDRSLSVTLSPTAPGGIVVHSQCGDHWKDCRDHVCGRLGIVTNGLQKLSALNFSTPVVSRASASEFAARLWLE